MRYQPFVGTLFALATGAAIAMAAKPPELASAWRTADLTIDGNDAEWPGEVTALTEAPLEVGVTNDAEFVYVRARTSDRPTGLQLLYGGLTVWFDPAGADRKAFGIRYPVGAKLPAPSRRRPEGGDPRDRPGERGDHLPPPDDGRDAYGRPRRLGASLDDPSSVVPKRAEVIGPGKDDVRSLVLAHLPEGIAVSLARRDGVLVYELKVPLVKPGAHQYSIGAVPGARIGIGFETGKVQQTQSDDKASGGRGRGGIPGIGVGGPGGMGQGPGGPDAPRGDLQATFKPIKLWTRVLLASATEH